MSSHYVFDVCVEDGVLTGSNVEDRFVKAIQLPPPQSVDDDKINN